MDDNDNALLEDLNVLELNILLGHLELGIEHLEKYLHKGQLSALLNCVGVKPHQRVKIKADALEKRGNVVIMVNTVFTCVLGGWLATVGFVGANPAVNKHLLAFIGLAAGVASGYFGYFSFKKVDTEAAAAIDTEKLFNLRLHLLRLLKEKREKQIQEIEHYLNETLVCFFKGNAGKTKNNLCSMVGSKKGLGEWFNQLNRKIDAEVAFFVEKKVYSIFIKHIKNIRFKLKKSIKANVELTQTLSSTTASARKQYTENKALQDKNKDKSFIAVLTDSTFPIPEMKITTKPWLRNNLYSLINGLVPTVLGGFCSLFTYVHGLPATAKEAGWGVFQNIFENLFIKSIALGLICAITLYFGYAFIHTHRKSFIRDQELEKTQKIIANKKTELLALESTLNFLKKIKNQVKILVLIFTFMRHVAQMNKKEKASLKTFQPLV